MKAAISVELGEASYSLEQDAFFALHAYLDRASTRLGEHPDRDEVLSGLERSIGAKLARGAARSAPFSGAEMTAVLREVGRVDGPRLGPARDVGPESRYGDSAVEPGFASESPGLKSREVGAWARPRRLYRLEDDRKIAGVCAGLAAYLGLDVGLLRALVIVAAIFTGFFIVLACYIALIFLMPVARTATEIAAAHGALRSA